MGLVEKLINLESKGYDNLGQGSPKDLAKLVGMKDWNELRMPKK